MKRFSLLIALLFFATSLIAWAGPDAPGSPDVTIRDGESLHLGDAGTTIVNGVYLPNGTANGYPKYQKDNSIFVYKVANGRWYISMVDGSEVESDVYYYSRPASTVDFVTDGRVFLDWVGWANGANPAPERWLDGFGQDVILVNDEVSSYLGEDDGCNCARSRNLTVLMPSPSSNDVTVNLSYGGTATGGGVDYTAPASVIIPAGQKTATVTITAVDDAIEDTDETIDVSISSVTNGTFQAPNTQTLTIYDDDAPFPTTLIVSGAAVGGTGETVNGIYAQVGTRNGVPVYKNAATGIFLFMDVREFWYFNYTDGDENAGSSLYSIDDNYRRLYVSGNDPDPEDWTPGISSPGAPGPTVREYTTAPSLHVGDAGTTIVNGVYLPNGTAFGYPKYKKDDNTTPMYAYKVASGQWFISEVDGSTVLGATNLYYTDPNNPVEFITDGLPQMWLGPGNKPERWLDGFEYEVRMQEERSIQGNYAGYEERESFTLFVGIPNARTDGKDVTVNLSYDGTATGGGVDYTAPASVTIPAGQKLVSFTISFVDDNIQDTNETIIVGIGSVENGTLQKPYTHTVYIVDDDAPFPGALIVTDAAVGPMGETVNGTYTQVGSRNGVPVYQHTTSGIFLFMDSDEVWYFNFTDGDENPATSLYATSDDFRRPYSYTYVYGNQGTFEDGTEPEDWLSGNNSPGAPGPTINAGVAPPPPVLVECLINGDFGLPDFNGVYTSPQTVNVPGWNTANFTFMEIWPAAWAAPAPGGGQFLELFSGGAETIYQDFQTTPGDVLSYSFYYRPRDSAQELTQVALGAPGATVVLKTTAGSPLNTWTEIAGTYTVPAGQTLTRFEIQGVTPSPSYGGVNAGNLIATASVQGTFCPPPPKEVAFALSASSLPSLPAGTFGEGEGSLTLTVTVEPQVALDADLTVDFTFADVTATRGMGPAKGAVSFDYSAPSSVTIPSGSFSAELTVTLNDDMDFEGDETFTVQLADGTGYTSFSAEGGLKTVTIKDNDLDPSMVECLINGDFGLPAFDGVYTSPRTADVPGWNTVNFDFMEIWPEAWRTPAPGGGQFLELFSAGAETIFQDFQTTPGDVLTYSFYYRPRTHVEELSQVAFGPPGATVVLQTTAGSPVSSWTEISGSYTVPAGQTLTRFEIQGVTPSPSFGGVNAGSLVALASVRGTFCPPPDPEVWFALSSSTLPNMPEGSFGEGEGSLRLLMTVEPQVALDADLTVNVTFADVTATRQSSAGKSAAEHDYAAPSFVTIPAGSSSAELTVSLNDDALYEGDETFTVKVADGPGYRSYFEEGGLETVTIKDNESAPTLSVAATNASEAENGGIPEFTFTLSDPSFEAISATVTPEGTATPTADYTGEVAPFTVSFAPGETSVTKKLTLVNDDVYEGDETITLTLSDPVNATIGAGTATVTIQESLDPPVVSLDLPETPVVKTEGDDPMAVLTAEITAEINRKSTVDVTIPLSLVGSTATQRSLRKGDGPEPAYDFVGPGSILISAGELSSTATFHIVGDLLDEPDETIVVQISNPGNTDWTLTATPAETTQTITIQDDDDAPVATLSLDPPGDDEGLSTFTIDEDGGDVTGKVKVIATLDAPSGFNIQIPLTFPDLKEGGLIKAVPVIECGASKNCTPGEGDYSISQDFIYIQAGHTAGAATILAIDNDDYVGDRNAYIVVGSPLSNVTANIAPDDRVTVTVKEDEGVPFKAVDDEATTAEDTPVLIDVLANDDAGGVPATEILAIEKGTATLIGTAEIVLVTGETPKIRYTPKRDWNGVENFNYRSTDGNGNKDVQKVTVTVTPVNDAPVANDYTVPAGTKEDETFTIPIANLGTDVDQALRPEEALTVNFVSAPTKGVATFTDGIVTVVPTVNANGVDSFEFTVTDNGTPAATSETKKVSWALAPVFDEPVFTNGSTFEVERGQSMTLKLDEILTTVDGPTLRLGDIRSNREAYGADKPLSGVDVTVLSVTGKNTLVLGKDQSSLTYTAATSFTGEETFSLAILHTVAGDYTAADVDNPAKTYGVANMDITINVTGVATVVSLTSPNGAPATNPLYRLGTGSGSPASRTYRIEASKNVGLDTVVELEATGRAAVGTDYQVFNDLHTPTLAFIIKRGTKAVDFTVSAMACLEDVNKDGLVNLTDASDISDHPQYGGAVDGEADTYFDVNSDGQIDSVDRNLVVRRYLANRTVQTCPETADLAIKTVTPGAVSSSAKSLSIPLKTIQTQRIELVAQIPSQLSAYEGGGSSGAAQSRFVAFAVKTEDGSNVTSDVVVGLTTSGATEGSDFRLIDNNGALTSLVIRSGTSGTTFSLEVLDDAVFEGDESVTITMTSVTGASPTADAAKRSYTRTIVDNDVQPLVVPDAYLTINATTWCSQLLTRQLVSYRQILTAANYAGSLNPVSGPVTYNATTAYSLAVSGFLVPNELDRFIDITFPADTDFCFGSAQELSVPFQIDVIETGQNPRTARMNVVVRIGSPNRAVVNVTQQTSQYVGQPITVESPTGTTLEAVQSTNNPSPDPLPMGVESPVGFLQFNVTNVTPGGTTTVEVTLPDGVVLSDYWKYGPRLGANAPCPTSAGNAACVAAKKAHWYKWNLKNGVGAEQVGNVLKLHFKDGQLGDFDLTENGVIIDPGVPVFTTNAAPVAVADAATSLEDGSVAIDFLSNDTDADGDVITFALTTDPANGTWTDNGDGTGTYTPNADFFGTDSFTYTIDDGYANAEVGTVTIDVTGTPDVPVAVDDAATTTNTTQAVVNVFANDYDPDGDEPFYLSAISNPANGVASFLTDGTVTYTPNAGFVGQDTITYSITDGASGVYAQATVTITVTGALAGPVAADDASTTAEETAVSVAVLSNDVDPQGDALTVATFTQGANGTVTAGESGTLVYTPAADFNGTDSFTYTATDGADTSAPVTVTVTVSAVNDAPVFADGSAIVATDGPVWIGGELDPAMPDGAYEVAFDVTATDVDDDGLTYTWQLASRTDFAEVLMSVEGASDGASVPWSDILDALVALEMLPGDEVTLAQRVEVSDADGLTATTEAQDLTFIRGLITANELGGELPTEYFLDGNYPNPFNPVTTIRFGLPETGDVNVVVYDMMGRQVATLAAGTLPAGVHEVQFDASNLPSGAYIYRLATPAGQYVKTMMLLK